MTALTPRVVCYMGHEEGLVLEAYLDSKNVWTWALGVATTGGNNVLQYKDKPQPLEKAIRASVDLINRQYLPAVVRAFGAHNLTENELAAALSFHWNTGAIARTSWVPMVVAGQRDAAETFLRTHYLNGGLLDERRDREADLFFDNKWPADMRTNVQRVSKPSYRPYGSYPTDISAVVQQVMGGQ